MTFEAARDNEKPLEYIGRASLGQDGLLVSKGGEASHDSMIQCHISCIETASQQPDSLLWVTTRTVRVFLIGITNRRRGLRRQVRIMYDVA